MDSISKGRDGFEEWAALEFILATNKQTDKQAKKHVLGSEIWYASFNRKLAKILLGDEIQLQYFGHPVQPALRFDNQMSLCSR